MNTTNKKLKPNKNTKSNKTRDTLLSDIDISTTNVLTKNKTNLSREELELELAQARQIIKEQNKVIKSKDKAIYKERVKNEALKKLSILLGVK